MLSPSARFSGFSSEGSSFGGRGETSRSIAPAPMLAMLEMGRVGSSPNAVGAFDGPELAEDNVHENGEDLIAMYMDMGKLNSSLGFYGLEEGGQSTQATPQAPYSNENMMVSPSEKPIVKHQQSLSFDGLTLTKPELLISSPERTLSPESRKALSAAKLAEIALVIPKRAKRQSAARSQGRKRLHVSELEQKVKDLETKATALSAQLEMAKRDTTSLIAENNGLKARLQFMEKQVQLQDAVNNALNDEVGRLRVTGGMGSPNGGHVRLYGSIEWKKTTEGGGLGSGAVSVEIVGTDRRNRREIAAACRRLVVVQKSQAAQSDGISAAITPLPVAGLLAATVAVAAVAGEEALPALRDACAVDVEEEFWNRPLLQNRTVEEEEVSTLINKFIPTPMRYSLSSLPINCSSSKFILHYTQTRCSINHS
ncbi:hypothetical protein MRB53_016078 [Persea americana]|uniref:Uncharacterized protein n=1 Tax=Persea americana TaxID=3435 RepID=A0ACC2M113_PERAE|nr:hypothetical protein MRB53_016078 [Persea americana]